MPKTKRSLEQRFWAKVDQSAGPDACWPWMGAKTPKGYGLLGLGGLNHNGYAHRLAWEFANGPIPPGMLVCHTCDTPQCVNVSHLFVGSYADNTHDMMDKGRGNFIGAPRKIKVDQVGEVRQAFAGGVSRSTLADERGVSYGAIYDVTRDLTNGHITYERIGFLLGVSRQRVHQLYKQGRLTWSTEGDDIVVLRDGEQVAGA